MNPGNLDSFLGAIKSDPALRDELRRAVLTDDLLAVPHELRTLTGAVTHLVEAQERTEVRLAALTTAQEQTEVRLAALTAAQEQSEVRLVALTDAQGQTEVRLAALTAAQEQTAHVVQDLGKALNRRVGALEDMAGAVFEPQLSQKVPGLLAKSRLRVQPLTREELALYLQSSGASDEHMAALVDQPDFLGIATGEGGSALVIAEASLMADDHDVERLESWRYVAQQYGIPVILVLVARRRGRFLPSRDELASRGIAWSISNERDRRVPEPQLGKFDLRPS